MGWQNGLASGGVNGGRGAKGETEMIACGQQLFLNALVCILALMLLCHVSMLMQHV